MTVGANPVYVTNTYPAASARHIPTHAIRLIQTQTQPNAISIASYAYQPVQASSVIYSNASVLNVNPAIATTASPSAMSGQSFTVYTPGK